jgi:hypothetical protein
MGRTDDMRAAREAQFEEATPKAPRGPRKAKAKPEETSDPLDEGRVILWLRKPLRQGEAHRICRVAAQVVKDGHATVDQVAAAIAALAPAGE